ncbi:hypothetical protein BSU04_38140 [Caballeronia sordidicola]|uniref:Uncharacterized protein n=1 Tax=Caballeronia sordidicola TaxID=196367 RepID=A0A226WQV1_CABSO|nr:hypothetical protein BSU04_38140 [Caballeronia sordidicola]
MMPPGPLLVRYLFMHSYPGERRHPPVGYEYAPDFPVIQRHVTSI